MIIVFDIGNTEIVFTLFANEKKEIRSWRARSDASKTADEYAAVVISILKLNQVCLDDIEGAAIASVVPVLESTMAKLCRRYFNLEPFIVHHQCNALVEIAIPSPETVGADIIANINMAARIAGENSDKKDVIVVDMGTATVFAISNNKHFTGALITAGIGLTLRSLGEGTAKLPQIAFTRPKNLIGDSTITAMQSGVYWGYISMIEGLMARLKSQGDFYVVATGGITNEFTQGALGFDLIDPDLTIKGIKLLYDLNVSD